MENRAIPVQFQRLAAQCIWHRDCIIAHSGPAYALVTPGLTIFYC
jgi:hypothetical protein